MAKTDHLIRRYRTWYFILGVPADVQEAFGKTHIKQSLKTHDLLKACELRDELLAAYRRRFRELRTKAALEGFDSPEAIVAAAKTAYLAIQLGTERKAVLEGWNLHLDALGQTFPEDLPEDLEDAIRLGHRIIHGNAPVLLSEAISKHLEGVEGTVTTKTLNTRKRRLDAFQAWAGEVDVDTITKRRAAAYITSVLIPASGAIKTKKDTVADLSAAFAWMATAGLIESNPFKGLSSLVRESKRGAERVARRAWTDAELARLLACIERDLGKTDYLYRLVLIGAYSGMRLDEICSITGEDIEDGCFLVREGKTASSVRRVPIHPAIHHFTDRLNGFLIPGLRPGGEDRKRGHRASKRFGYYARKWEFGPELVFHGLRASFITKLEAAGVPVTTAELLVGHRRQSLSYGRYSQELPVEQLREAVHLIQYSLPSWAVTA